MRFYQLDVPTLIHPVRRIVEVSFALALEGGATDLIRSDILDDTNVKHLA